MRQLILVLAATLVSCTTDPNVGRRVQPNRSADASTSGSRDATIQSGAGTGPNVSARCNVVATRRSDGPSFDAGTANTLPALETLRGPVSYYSDSLHGRRTASGDRYDRHQLTAASRTLPFGAIVRIRRADDPNKSAIVRINDRGPFGRNGRILDLSRAAAECIDIVRRGVAEVHAEIIDWGPRGRPSR